MNTNLMRAAGIQAALDQRVISQSLDRFDVRHRALADVGLLRAAAPPVAAVADQLRLDRLRGQLAADHCQVAAAGRVPAKLLRAAPRRPRWPRLDFLAITRGSRSSNVS